MGDFIVQAKFGGRWTTQPAPDGSGDSFDTEGAASSFADRLAEESTAEQVRVVRLAVLYTVGMPTRGMSRLRRE